MSTVAVILAAGLGKRMKSSLPKVLHPVLGDPSLLWVLRSLPAEVSAAVLVLHHGKDRVEAALAEWERKGLLPCPVHTVDQLEPLGTGHAVQQAVPVLERLAPRRVVILCGDVPLLRTESIAQLAVQESAMLAMDLEEPAGYGRVLQNADGSLAGIVEQKDASPEVLAIRRVNGGAYALPWQELKPALAGLSNDNAQKEYYLTDAVVTVAKAVPMKVELCDAAELLGMNSRVDQAQLQAYARKRINTQWMEAGVTFLDPEATLVGPRVSLAQDVLLEPGVRLEGKVIVGEGTRIGQGSAFQNCQIGKGVEIRPYCIGQDTVVGDLAKIGPFAHLREGTKLDEKVHVGNFVETKKTHMHAGAKANHLSYLGDCEVGERTNIGAGLITCNYDGFHKHKTLIGKDVFVGSDCQLVAPIQLGDGCLIGAGSTITQNVPANALALTRSAQTIKEGAAQRLRDKLKGGLG